MYSGNEFQMEEAAAGKARLPTVESLTDGTMRRLVAADRRFVEQERYVHSIKFIVTQLASRIVTLTCLFRPQCSTRTQVGRDVDWMSRGRIAVVTTALLSSLTALVRAIANPRCRRQT